jgi:hypothetical protein
MGTIGSHRIEVEGDVVWMTIVGDLSLEEARKILEVTDGVIRRHGHYGALVDTRRMGNVSSETRRMLAKWPGHRHCYGNTLYGANLATRALLSMLLQGIKLFMKMNTPTAFLRTEEEARAWLRRQHEQAIEQKA